MLTSQKLTLLVPSASVRAAKRYAKLNKTSLSAIVTEAFAKLPMGRLDRKPRGPTPLTDSLIGIASLGGRDIDDVRAEALMEKYELKKRAKR